jgi:hypothetical protein
MGQILNRFILQKVKGGALQYTIVFSLLIIMSLLLFFMYIRFSSLEVYVLQKQSQLIENINSAIVILENHPEFFGYGEHQIQLTEDSTFLTDIKISDWGFYDHIVIVARQGKQQLSKLFLFTDDIRKYNILPSLYLSGASQYLSLGGKTYIGANTFLPSLGIRESYLNGIGYNRDSLVQGLSYTSDAFLPDLNSFWKERYDNLKKKIIITNDIVNMKSDSIIVSFKEPTLVLKCPDKYELRFKYIKGNIIIVGTKIHIANSSSIHQCIIKADSIIIEKNFKGEVQLIADKYIEIGESSVLMPPSVIYLENYAHNEQVKIKSNTLFIGEIVIPNHSTMRRELLIIESGVRLIGQIYCNGYSSFEGIVYGSYYSAGFITKTRTGIYENYLVDVCIDNNRLPKEYCGISLIEKSYAKVCAEELY